jgi:hypothetical protein
MLNVNSSSCLIGELVRVLQSEYPPENSTQTSKDSPTAFCPLGNTISCPSVDIGSANCLWIFFSLFKYVTLLLGLCLICKLVQEQLEYQTVALRDLNKRRRSCNNQQP